MATRTEGGNAAFHNFNNDYAHIADPNERRRLALAEIDKAPFGWYHVRAILVAGIGFFTDAYDIFAIGIVTTMLGAVSFPRTRIPLSRSLLPEAQSLASSASDGSQIWLDVKRCTAWNSF
jgi:PHS family inorganic phosphate transporter-like MFS transporter